MLPSRRIIKEHNFTERSTPMFRPQRFPRTKSSEHDLSLRDNTVVGICTSSLRSIDSPLRNHNASSVTSRRMMNITWSTPDIDAMNVRSTTTATVAPATEGVTQRRLCRGQILVSPPIDLSLKNEALTLVNSVSRSRRRHNRRRYRRGGHNHSATSEDELLRCSCGQPSRGEASMNESFYRGLRPELPGERVRYDAVSQSDVRSQSGYAFSSPTTDVADNWASSGY